MNLDELRSVQAKERRKDSLQHLRDAFYDNVAAYLSDLRAARDRRASEVENPFSDDDVRRMSDEIETAEEVAEALYERRVGKVVKLASFAAAEMPVETEGMTSQERALFEDLVERIGANKSVVLDALSGATTPGQSGMEPPAGGDPGPTPDATEAAAADPVAEPDGALAEAMGASVETPDAADPSDETAVPPTEPPATGPDGVDPDPEAIADPKPDGVADPASGRVTAEGADSPTPRGENPVPVDPEPAPPGAVDADPTADVSAGTPDEAVSADAERSAGDDIDVNGAAHSASTTDQDRTTVRITADVGEIFGTDEREYHLTSEDVVSLPAANAEPLLKRDAAEPIE